VRSCPTHRDSCNGPASARPRATRWICRLDETYPRQRIGVKLYLDGRLDADRRGYIIGGEVNYELGRSQASLSCAAVRYAQLTGAPVIVVLSRGDEVEWVVGSQEVREADFYRYNATKTARLPPRSATRRLADTSAAVHAGEEKSSTDYLSDWFPRAPDRLSVEVDALGLGTYGRVLSLLVCQGLPDPDELYLQEQLGEDGQDDESDWRSEMRRQSGYGDR
jgi:hypothetical protein